MTIREAVEKGIKTWARAYPPEILDSLSLSDLATDVTEVVCRAVDDAYVETHPGIPSAYPSEVV